MKNFIITAFITTIITFHGYGQSICDITNHYGDFITIEKMSYNEKEYLIKRVVETSEKNCFSDLINNRTLFVGYLLTNFSSDSNYEDLLKLPDSSTIRKTYFSDLKNDSLFNSVMADFANKTINKNTSKDTISLNNMLNIAVKYFSINGINDMGQYEGKVCAGTNLILKTEKKRKPFIEAFCFSSILKHYRNEDYSMYDEFAKAIGKLNSVNLGIDREEELFRAQGAMFLLMRDNKNLREMLKSEFEKNKEYLPFVLREDLSE